MNKSIHRHTPTLTAIDSRGLAVRHVNYLRTQPGDTPEARITRHTYNATGDVIAAWDARQFEASGPANQTSVFSLGGAVLITHNTDAGVRLNRYNDNGDIKESWDSRGTHWQTDYDLMLRPLALSEQGKDQPARVILRFTYLDASPDAALRNQCGRVSREDDSAGTLLFPEYGLLGEPLSETRHFLNSLEQPDWPHAVPARDQLLEPGAGAQTHSRSGPTGDPLEQIDALGNVQRWTYDVSGQLSGVTLSPQAGAPHLVLTDVAYNAQGQILRQRVGNGVITQTEYDPANGQVLNMHTLKPGHGKLQALSYTYDPVGNVVRIEDSAQATRHFANQRIDPVNHYTYDSLYQLIKATGREALGATIGPQLPKLDLTPGDTGQLLNYTQHYEYDNAGNLTRLQHVGHNGYTRLKTVSKDSNRCLSIPQHQGAPDFKTLFDANGNLQALQSGQHLQWNQRNQLQRVVALAREDGDHDEERFVYDGAGVRRLKITTIKAKNNTRVQVVRYLPGLEIHNDGHEHLEIISVQAGCGVLRHLHWVSGKPADIDNNQHRYSFDDTLGSSTLELDQRASLLSHEGYYPFGGSAWWAAKSALQATYKTIRYSGKERDASGLYYYGQRYYAPWLQQWINPDPGGTVDGLNLYRMVGNNPVSLGDADGQQGSSKQSGSNLGMGHLSTRAGDKARAARKQIEAANDASHAAVVARNQAVRPLKDAVSVHLEVLKISRQRVEAAHQQLLNHSSYQTQMKSAVKRAGTLVASSAIGTGAGIGGALLGSMMAPGIGTAGGFAVGFAVGKTAGVITDYVAERTGMSASVKLKTGPLSADKIFTEGEHKTINLTGYAAAKFSKMLPTSEKGAYKLGKEVAKTALGKAPLGAVLKVLPEIPELVHENIGAAAGLSQAKLEKLDNRLTTLTARIDESMDAISSMFDQLGVSSVSTPVAGDLFKKSTAQDISAKTLNVTQQLQETRALGRQLATRR
jgi:insecticidal toxin complex protein TccC